MYYFNHSAATKPDSDVLDVYLKVSQKYFMNTGINRTVEQVQTDARELIKKSLGLANPSDYEVIFTSGGTEANNLAILGFAKKFSTPKHFITSIYEHSSAHECFEKLQDLGHEVTYLKPNLENTIEVKSVLDAIQKNTVFVSLMALNNEIGEIIDVELIAKKVKELNPQIVFMSDYIQALGKLEINFSNIDLITLSSYKINGPHAVGAIIMEKQVELEKLMYGGFYEGDHRGGSQSVAGQVAFAYAVKKVTTNFPQNQQLLKHNYEYLKRKLVEVEGLVINTKHGINIVSCHLKIKPTAEVVVNELEKKGIYVSTKSACSVKLNRQSRALMAIGLTVEQDARTLRISVCTSTTVAEIDFLVENLQKICEDLRWK
ncbi:MAG: cysteine desulfurase family protein [Mycoplasmatales bacterium]